MHTVTMWKNRRAMAWIGISVGFLLFPVAFVAFPELVAIATPVYSLITFLLVMYKGTALMDDKWHRDSENKGEQL